MSHWVVIVGNLGTVYGGTNGRAAGESVTLLRDDDVALEHATTEES